jgi:N-succinyldiaminopimelate aminotransferase
VQGCGIVAIAAGVFCDDVTTAPTLARLAFCKRDKVIAEAAERFARLASVEQA